MGKRKIGHCGANKGNEWDPEEIKLVSGKARRDVHEECVPGQWERMVIGLSHLEQDTRGEQAGHKDGEIGRGVTKFRDYQLTT